jgi:hypothetical protein
VLKLRLLNHNKGVKLMMSEMTAALNRKRIKDAQYKEEKKVNSGEPAELFNHSKPLSKPISSNVGFDRWNKENDRRESIVAIHKRLENKYKKTINTLELQAEKDKVTIEKLQNIIKQNTKHPKKTEIARGCKGCDALVGCYC